MTALEAPAQVGLQQRARAGDLTAFNELVELHQRTLYAVAVRMLNDAALAADVTQESLLAAWQQLDTFHGGSFRAWLTRIVVNRCYDLLRRRKRKAELSYDALLTAMPDSERLAGEEADAAQLTVSRELGEQLLAGLATLAPDQRAVLVLCDVQDYSYAEAAEVEHTNVGTIKSRLSRGRARMRDWLAARPELLPPALRSIYSGMKEQQ